VKPGGAFARDWNSQTERVTALLASAGLPGEESFLRRFPGEVSVGQAQRILIVMSLLHAPALLIADEPTSASTRSPNETSGPNRKNQYGTPHECASHLSRPGGRRRVVPPLAILHEG